MAPCLVVSPATKAWPPARHLASPNCGTAAAAILRVRYSLTPQALRARVYAPPAACRRGLPPQSAVRSGVRVDGAQEAAPGNTKPSLAAAAEVLPALRRSSR